MYVDDQLVSEIDVETEHKLEYNWGTISFTSKPCPQHTKKPFAQANVDVQITPTFTGFLSPRDASSAYSLRTPGSTDIQKCIKQTPRFQKIKKVYTQLDQETIILCFRPKHNNMQNWWAASCTAPCHEG